MRKLKTLDLFSGIGGMALGLHRTGGFKTVAFCEVNAFCQGVLRKNFPGTPIYGDIRELSPEAVQEAHGRPDLICGGFPCQDVSYNQRRRQGVQEGTRSGLWFQFKRLIEGLRPKWVLIENVPGLLSKGMETVLEDLHKIRYDAEWLCVPASAFGLPHLRERVLILAYPTGSRQPKQGYFRAHSFSGRQGEAWQATPAVHALCRGSVPVLCGEHNGPAFRLDREHRLTALGNALVPQVSQFGGTVILRAEKRKIIID